MGKAMLDECFSKDPFERNPKSPPAAIMRIIGSACNSHHLVWRWLFHRACQVEGTLWNALSMEMFTMNILLRSTWAVQIFSMQLDGKPHQSNQAIPQRSFCRLDMQLWKPHATSPTPTPSTWARLNCQPTGDSKAVCVSCKSWCLMHHCEAFHASPQNSSNVLEAALKSRCLISKAAFLSSRFCLRAWSPCWMKFSKSSARILSCCRFYAPTRTNEFTRYWSSCYHPVLWIANFNQIKGLPFVYLNKLCHRIASGRVE